MSWGQAIKPTRIEVDPTEHHARLVEITRLREEVEILTEELTTRTRQRDELTEQRGLLRGLVTEAWDLTNTVKRIVLPINADAWFQCEALRQHISEFTEQEGT